jgi:hypothetical protein
MRSALLEATTGFVLALPLQDFAAALCVDVWVDAVAISLLHADLSGLTLGA